MSTAPAVAPTVFDVPDDLALGGSCGGVPALHDGLLRYSVTSPLPSQSGGLVRQREPPWMVAVDDPAFRTLPRSAVASATALSAAACSAKAFSAAAGTAAAFSATSLSAAAFAVAAWTLRGCLDLTPGFGSFNAAVAGTIASV